jgi:hypothetical protein
MAATPVDMAKVQLANAERLQEIAKKRQKEREAARRKVAADAPSANDKKPKKGRNTTKKKGGRKFDGPPKEELAPEADIFNPDVYLGESEPSFDDYNMRFAVGPRVGHTKREFPRANGWATFVPCGDHNCPHKESRQPVVLHTGDRPRRDGSYPTRVCGNLFGNFCRHVHRCNDFKSEQGCPGVHITIPTKVTLIGRNDEPREVDRVRHLRLNEVVFGVHRSVVGDLLWC